MNFTEIDFFRAGFSSPFGGTVFPRPSGTYFALRFFLFFADGVFFSPGAPAT